MSKIKVIYHEADLDGLASGAIMHLHHSMMFSDDDEDSMELIPHDYHKDFNIKKTRGNICYMIDVSIKLPLLFDVARGSSYFYLVDHHKSFYDDFLKYCVENSISLSIFNMGPIKMHISKENNLCYYYSDVLSGCEMTARLFHDVGPSYEIVQLLGQYDTWRNTSSKMIGGDQDWNDVVLPFQYGMRLYKTPESISRLLYNADNSGSKYVKEDIIKSGKDILSFLDIKYESDLAQFHFTMEMNGIRFLCMNTNNFSSLSFEKYWNEDLFDAMMAFNFTGTDWKFSLYTTKKDVDILKIASFFNGGGHSAACGFRLPHNQVVFRKGKIELGLLLEIDICNIPETYKGLSLDDIVSELKKSKGNICEIESSVEVKQEQEEIKQEEEAPKEEVKKVVRRGRKPAEKKEEPKKRVTRKKKEE